MSKDEAAAKWPWNWFGFWGGLEKGLGDCPAVLDFVDAHWIPPDKEAILRYLEETPVAVAAATGHISCLMCDARHPRSSFQSDGSWLWPTSLAHYARVHHVRVPVRLVEAIRARNHVAPSKVDVSPEKLPWPPASKE